MIRIWCRNRHGQTDLCDGCQELLAYANNRIDRCVFGPDKPACNDCTVHCYAPEKREQIREVMRFSGPRMIYRHPVLTVIHMLK